MPQPLSRPSPKGHAAVWNVPSPLVPCCLQITCTLAKPSDRCLGCSASDNMSASHKSVCKARRVQDKAVLSHITLYVRGVVYTYSDVCRVCSPSMTSSACSRSLLKLPGDLTVKQSCSILHGGGAVCPASMPRDTYTQRIVPLPALRKWQIIERGSLPKGQGCSRI